MAGWTAADIPDQSGRTVVVTGANSGIGLCTAGELARRGATVVLGCRDAGRGKSAVDRIRGRIPDADLVLLPLDLADLASVREFAEACPSGVDVLVNNAGVMALPHRTTVDGFETQFGVNHLGHFALTGLLLPKLLARPGARVVNVSSGLHVLGNLDFGDLNSERRYHRWMAYGRSKTANLLFTHALARRTVAAGLDLVPTASHPGYASTNLTTVGLLMEGRRTRARMARFGDRLFAQPASAGALPSLYAATAPGVAPDSFYGPRFVSRGAPAPSWWRARWTRDDRSAEMLWGASEQLTGVRYPGL